MPSESDIRSAMFRRGLVDDAFLNASDEAVAAAVRRLLNPEFCGIRQNLEVGEIGQRFCRWPQDDIRLAIVEVIPSLGKEKMQGACQAACDDISRHLQLDFSFVDDAGAADIAIHVNPLGGPMGVLAQCTLVPCGIKRGQFQGTLEADQYETWVWAETPSGMAIDWQRVFAHELLHGAGLPHITTPRCLMNPTYSTTIRLMQPGDVDAMVMLGYKRRAVTVPSPGVPTPTPRNRPYTTSLSPGQTYTAKGYAVAVDYVN